MSANTSQIWNGYEDALSLQLNFDNVTVINVGSVPVGWAGPVYLCIQPDVAANREWIKADTVDSGLNEFRDLTRDLEGSAGPLTHPQTSLVRAVVTRQLIQDIFGDIDAHAEDTDDPHSDAGYIKLATAQGLFVAKVGDVMTGLLTLSGPPTANLHAATKVYVDDLINGLPVGFDGLHASLTDLPDPSAHHTRYNDGEAQGAMGPVSDGNPFHHNRYTDGEAVSAVGPHTVKYTDGEAVSAMGGVGDGNNLNHVKFADAPVDGQLYGRRDGAWAAVGADFYSKSEIDGFLASYYTKNDDPRAIAGRRIYIQAGDPGAIANNDIWHDIP